MRRKLTILLLGPLLAASTPAPLAALDRFVATGGSDDGDCSSPDSPCGTIQYAIDQASDNDTIKIAASTIDYRENLTIQRPVTGLVLDGGWWGAAFTKRYNDPEETSIDGGETAPVLLLSPVTGAAAEVRIQNVTLYGGATGDYGGCVYVNTLLSTATLTLADSVIQDCAAQTGGGVAVRSLGDGATSILRVQNTRLADNRATYGGGAAAVADLGGEARLELVASIITENEATDEGAGVYAISHREASAVFTASNTFVTDNVGSEGVLIEARACPGCSGESWTDAWIVNATLAGEPPVGLRALGNDGGATSVDITNTIFWHQLEDLDLRGNTVATASYSVIRDVDATEGATYTPGTGVVKVDPQFDEWWPETYHLSRTSPVIDFGLCGIWIGDVYLRIAPYDDFDGEPRPPFGAYFGCDLGADEFVPYERFVTPGGSDADNDCADPALPCLTVQRALDEVMADDGKYRNYVFLARGVYPETLSASGPPEMLRVIGGWSDDFTSQDRDSSLTVIDAGGAGTAFSLHLDRQGFWFDLQNLTLRNGTGMGGGGFSLYCLEGYGTVWLARSSILENQATWGAGVHAQVEDCHAQLVLFSTLVASNSASSGGGGIRGYTSGAGSLFLRLVHSTVTDNEAGFADGILQENHSTGDAIGRITGSIVWGNAGDDLGLFDFGDSCTVRADYSDVGSLFNFGCNYLPDGTVVSTDPLFADPGKDDFHLAPLSPLVDQSVCREWVLHFEDFEGDPRPLGSACDMGADEYAAPACLPLALWHDGDGIDPVATPAQSSGCLAAHFAPGESIQLTAQADPGWRIAGWSGTANDASTESVNSLTMPAAPASAGVLYGLFDHLVLSHETFTESQTRMACRSIQVGPAVVLESGAALDLIAPDWVEFVDDVEVLNGAALSIELSTPAPCD